MDEDEEDEEEDEYWQEEESCEDMEESVNHGELSMQHSPTKNPEKQKTFFFHFTLHTYVFKFSESIISHYCFIIHLN